VKLCKGRISNCKPEAQTEPKKDPFHRDERGELVDKENFNIEEEVTSMINVLTQRPNMTVNCLQGESRTIIFDTKDLFPTKAQT
jgi:hypothetical protein